MRSKFKWILTLLVAFSMQFSFAQEKTITGVVSDASGSLPGVNVVVKGTTRGASTSFDGSYSIKAKVGEVLEYSFMGMNNITRTVGQDNVINVLMQEEATKLNEVVITSLGIKKRTDAITATTQKVNSDLIMQAQSPNAAQALTGKVSGLQINVTNSSVDSNTKITLRGARSISGNNEALVVIDGAVSTTTALQQIPPDMIDNMNVIKGSQGAALYGSQGINGVVIVNTKKGSKGGKLSVSINSSIDFTDVAYLPQTQLKYGQGWDGTHSSFENGSWGPEFDGSIKPVGLIQANGQYIYRPYTPIKNNIKNFFKTGTITQNSISVSSGTEKDGYFNLSANRFVNDFIVEGDKLKRNGFLFSVGKEFNKFSISGNFNLIQESVSKANPGNLQDGVYEDLLNTASNIPVELFSHGLNENNYNGYFKNPYWTIRNKRQDNNQTRFTSIIKLGYKLNSNINFSYLANLRFFNTNNEAYNNGFVDNFSATYGFNNKSELSSYTKTSVNDRNYYGDFIANFDYKLTEDIGFKANVGNNIQEFYRENYQVGGNNLLVPGVYNYSNVLNPLLPTALNNGKTLRRSVAGFAQVDLDYKEFLFLNLTGRNEWSSVFAKANNNFFYPSAGISFIPTKAIGALKDNKILNYAKLYANYTRVGNDNALVAYDTNLLSAAGDGFPFPGIVGNSFVLDRFQTDADITPEFVTTKEFGANFDFLNSRITLGGSYYIQDTDNLITNISTTATGGLVNLLGNIGTMQNKGYEIDFGFIPFKSENGITWDNRINFTSFKSTITSLKGGAKSVELRNSGTVGIFAEVGEEFPLIKGQSFEKDELGRIKIASDGLPIIDNNFKKLGKATPDYIVGLNSTLSYKGFRLAATMDYRTGHQFYSGVKSQLAFTGQLIEQAENRTGFIMPNSSYDYNGNGVYEANESNTNVVTAGTGVSSIINYYNTRYTTAAENLVLDATAFKVREVSLSYAMPKKFLEPIGLSSLVLGVNARNIFTWLPKENRGYNDPESAEATGNLTSGLAFLDRYPAQSSYGFSVNLKF